MESVPYERLSSGGRVHYRRFHCIILLMIIKIRKSKAHAWESKVVLRKLMQLVTHNNMKLIVQVNIICNDNGIDIKAQYHRIQMRKM